MTQSANAVTRRTFLGGVAAGIVSAEETAAPAAPLVNPNILVIIVDQMRFPTWLNAQQSQTYVSSVIPNIYQNIITKSVSFTQYYTAAAFCTPARSTLLTGLYAPQTAMFVTSDTKSPDLDPAFPTWGKALPALNAAYADRVWWFGKWHLSAFDPQSDPLAAYGFSTSQYPGPLAGSPNGWPNEGANGGVFTDAGTYSGRTFASDAQIVDDFVTWANAQASSAPWCATVSLINPHDIFRYPNWLNPTIYPQLAAWSLDDAHFPPPSQVRVPLYSGLPSPWNFEQPSPTDGKPPFQYSHWQFFNKMSGQITTDAGWVNMLNTYYGLMKAVDAQIGRVFAALPQAVLDNTVVVFLSDHGEHCGSHGQRGKGGGVYEESMHTPLYVRYPSVAAGKRTQLVSSVDLFGLICDLGTQGAGSWRTSNPDLATRESIHKFIFNPSAVESHRLITVAGTKQPFILHTVDENEGVLASDTTSRNHIVGLRLKATSTQPGAKYAAYSHWASCTTQPDGAGFDEEFYDYGNSLLNKSELGNDISTTDAASLAVLNSMRSALRTLASGELNRPLVGPGLHGALTAARARYYAYLGQCGA